MSSSAPDLTDYDIILINTSAGKDSQTMMRVVVEAARAAGVLDRVVAVHADLGRVEWAGTKELARSQSEDHYNLRFELVSRTEDLLDHVESKGRTNQAKGSTASPWPSSKARYCTSDHKRGQIRPLMTKLVRELGLSRPVKLLNCMGMRAEESDARAKKSVFSYDESASGKGTVKQVWNWLPIFAWTEVEVWADIKTSGVPHHPAYDAGMPRLSCCFCVLAPKHQLVLAAQLNPALADEYVAVEMRVGSRFTQKLSMAEVVAEARAA